MPGLRTRSAHHFDCRLRVTGVCRCAAVMKGTRWGEEVRLGALNTALLGFGSSCMQAGEPVTTLHGSIEGSTGGIFQGRGGNMQGVKAMLIVRSKQAQGLTVAWAPRHAG